MAGAGLGSRSGWVKKMEVDVTAVITFFSEAEEMVLQNSCCHIRAAVISSTQTLNIV